MFCRRCGLKVVEGNRFCQSCGQEVGVAEPGAPGVVNAPPIGMNASFASPLSYAGFWLRVVAYFIDGLILGIPMTLAIVVMFFLYGGFGLLMHKDAVDQRAITALMAPMFLSFFFVWIFFLVINWLYFAGMESSERQATFGKSVMSLRVTDLDGQRLSFGHATGRFFAKLVSGLIPLGIGYIMAGFTEKKQALHDMIAGTLVLRK